MRYLVAFVISVVTIIHAEGPGLAADPVRIRDVRVGFVNGNDDFHKSGAWAPVLVEVENQIIGEEFEGAVVVETADSDGVLTRFSPRRVFIAKNEGKRAVLTYIKVSGSGSDIRVTVKGKVGAQAYEHAFNYPGDRQGARANSLDSSHKLVLALGEPKGLEPPTEGESSERWDLGKNWHVAFQNNVNLLPDKWFGYEGVDVVVLPTGGTWSGSVAQALANDQLKRAALAQWVEMGGHLVVSASMNHNYVGNAQSFPLEPLLPARVETAGTIKIDRLDKVRDLVDSKVPRDRRFRRDSEVRSFADVEVARLHRRHQSLAMATEENPRLATIVQGSRGMGRITLLAFDTDQGPFTTWENRRDFWPALLGVKPTQDLSNTQGGFRMGRFGMESVSNDLASQLCTHLEQFGEVKVIPFAWVALFIFVYILIVGPLDYIILKKVVKRLEWTWVTFPLVVLCVSVGAFFLAQYLKGNELRINKLDVVEIDTHSNYAYGSTWFTVFSPRLQHYTVGIESAGFDKRGEGTVVSWMGRPGYSARGLGRSSGPGLFYRSYEFENEGQSLKGVPIQVWSMKTFTGRWQAPLDASKPAIIHDLKTDRLTLEGSLTSQLPFSLRSCQLVHQKYVWNLGTLEPGKRVPLPEPSQIASMSPNWGPSTPSGRTPRRNQYEQQFADTSLTGLVRQMMFYDALRNKAGQQAGASDYLEYLDQSWRLEFPEAVLIGMLDEEDGASDEINDKDRPGARLKPFEPRLRGTMRQTTVVRIYLPVTVTSAANP